MGDDASSDSDSEWEYEYHPAERETYVVTVDLTDPVRHTLKASQGASAAADPPPTKERAAAAAAAAAAGPSARDDTLQARGLASASPLIIRDGQLFACTWRDTVGTDLAFAPATASLPLDPAWADARVQLAAASRVRLVGAAARFEPKPAAPPAASEGTAAAAAPGGAGPAFRIPLEASAPPARRAQADFLARLVRTKARMGEFDRVFLGRDRTYAAAESSTPQLWAQGAEPVPRDSARARPEAKQKRKAAAGGARKGKEDGLNATGKGKDLRWVFEQPGATPRARARRKSTGQATAPEDGAAQADGTARAEGAEDVDMQDAS